MAYVSASDMKTFLEITSSDDDALFTSLIAAASRAVDRMTNRTFEASTATTRKFTPLPQRYGGSIQNDGRTLMFDEDLCALTSIVNGDGNTIPNTEYYLLAPNSTVYYGVALKMLSTYNWTYTGSPEQSVLITGKWAYSETCPADIALAVKKIVKHFYTSRAAESDSDRDVLSADGVVIAASKIPSSVTKLVSPYRKLS
jgi:hypothetical protein